MCRSDTATIVAPQSMKPVCSRPISLQQSTSRPMPSVNSMPPISETISLLAVKRPRSFAPTKLMSHLYLTGVVRLSIRYAPSIITTNSAVLTFCPSGTKGMM